MSRALAVFHGRFGRATVYQLNRPFDKHAHREGHLIFHIGGTPASIDVCEQRFLLGEGSIVAVNPWEPHNFVPTDTANGDELVGESSHAGDSAMRSAFGFERDDDAWVGPVQTFSTR